MGVKDNKRYRDASRFKPNVLAQDESKHKIIHGLIVKIASIKNSDRPRKRR